MSAQLLHYVRTIPNFMERIFFTDECSIWLTSNNMDDHLNADAHNGSALEVMQIPGLDKNVKIKVKVFAAVNVLLGHVFFDFITGTPGLRRCYIQPTAQFKVSQGLDLHMGDSCSSNRSVGFRV
jgi:hypothetical protein